jgi:hypothetical protein
MNSPFLQTALDDFAAGNFITGILRPYLTVMGDWFYAFLFLLILGIAYLKTQDMVVPTVLLMAGAAVIIPLFPVESHPILYLTMALTTAGVLYGIFKPH